MTSLSEKISILSNPAPTVLDPEDDVNIETVAKVEKQSAASEVLFTSSELRSKAAVLLEDCDPAYIGKKVLRKSLDGIFHDGSKDDLGSDRSAQSDDEEDEESEDYGDLEEFKQRLDKQIDSIEESGGDEEGDSVESEGSDDSGSSDDIANKFSNFCVTSETEKRDAVKAQRVLWNKLCESRIKLQKLLILANKLPQSNNWEIYKKNAGEDMSDCINKGSNSLKLLLNTCLDIQATFMSKIENESKSRNSGDEEIPSDTDEEMKEANHKEDEKRKTKTMKRKLKCDEYNEVLTKRFKTLMPYRNSVIQKWDEKTKLSSGNITQKSFSAFESSTLKQIEQILQDEDRLMKRTQLKRSLYRVLGKPDVSLCKEEEENSEINESESKQDMLLKDYDKEIFDDEDFYRKLLKEVIESKSVGIDPVVLRKQMEIQNIRNKIKKKVDTKASKGRKIRYDVHPKLVGFMRKIETATISDDARENLLKSFFGRSYLS